MSELNIPSQERMEKALTYLATSDEKYAIAAAEKNRKERLLKATLSLAMKASGEKTAAAQEREALSSEIYMEAIDAEFEAVKDLEYLKAKRSTEQTVIDVWRSINASQRKP